MTRRNSSARLIFAFRIERRSGVPAYRQICSQFRTLLAEGKAAAGEKLPSIRSLALQLGVSPDTVKAAYFELQDEGLIEARRGAGCTVCGSVAKAAPASGLRTARDLPLSEKALLASEAASYYRARNYVSRPFLCYGETMGYSVEKAWTRISASAARSPWAHTGYSSPKGYLPLREAIAKRLRQYRGILCSPENIVITSGTVQSLSLAASVLFRPGEKLLIESPAPSISSSVLAFCGLSLVPVPVDRDGMDIAPALERTPDARGIFTVPASQMPMSVSLSSERRQKMLSWARENNGWIIEDDMDNLAWFEGEPLPPLRAMPGAAPYVVYTDSFTLQFFPGIKLGYAVLPEPFDQAFAGAKLLSDRFSSESTQADMAAFLASEDYDIHLRKLQKLFRNRFFCLREALQKNFGDRVQVSPTRCGPHLTVQFDGVSDRTVEQEASEAGITVRALSRFSAAAPLNGLMLGFGLFEEAALLEAAGKLRKILASHGI